jgi:hypothetical protein
MPVSARWGEGQYCRNKNSFLAWRRAWTLATITIRTCATWIFCGEFLSKDYTAIRQEAWRTLNITLNRLLPALTKHLVENLRKNAIKELILVIKKWGIFQACAVLTH